MKEELNIKSEVVFSCKGSGTREALVKYIQYEDMNLRFFIVRTANGKKPFSSSEEAIQYAVDQTCY